MSAIEGLRSRRTRDDYYENEDDDEYLVNDIITCMDKAADEDEESNKEGKPGLKKLSQLEKVSKFLVN
jgi:transcription factor SPN1